MLAAHVVPYIPQLLCAGSELPSPLCRVLQPVGLAAGSLCLGQFSADQRWYRARVEAADARDPVNPQYSVTFIDYGNREALPASRVRAIEPQLAAVPPQALLCTLAFLKARQRPVGPGPLKPA